MCDKCTYLLNVECELTANVIVELGNKKDTVFAEVVKSYLWVFRKLLFSLSN